MSDGMRDANAVGEIGRVLDHAAHDLRRALKRAKDGHRGLTVDVVETVNEILDGSGYKLVNNFPEQR